MSIKRYQLTIDRFSENGLIDKQDWKDLISALVLVGYEVYGDNDKIIFELGNDDVLKEIKNDN